MPEDYMPSWSVTVTYGMQHIQNMRCSVDLETHHGDDYSIDNHPGPLKVEPQASTFDIDTWCYYTVPSLGIFKLTMCFEKHMERDPYT